MMAAIALAAVAVLAIAVRVGEGSADRERQAGSAVPLPAVAVAAAPDVSGRWNAGGYTIELVSEGGPNYTYAGFNAFGNQVDTGVAVLHGRSLHVEGTNSVYGVAFTADFRAEGDILAGTMTAQGIGSVQVAARR